MAAVEVIDGHLGVDATAVDADIVAVESGDAVDNPWGILHLSARRPHNQRVAPQAVVEDGIVGVEHPRIGMPEIAGYQPVSD